MLSNSAKSVILFGFLIAIASAAHRAGVNAPAFAPSTRGPASLAGLAAKKTHVFNPDGAAAPRHTEKLKGPSNVLIQLASAKPEKAGDIFVLTATISTAEPVDQIEFQWTLPHRSELVSGEGFGTLAGLEAGQTRSISITVKAGSDKNEQVHLMIKTTQGERQQAQSAQYNTQNQEAIDAANEEQRAFIESLAKEEEEAGGKKARLLH